MLYRKKNIEKFIKKNNVFINFVIVAFLALGLEFIVSNICYYTLNWNIYSAHITGMVSGFLLQYVLLFKWVYKKKIDFRSFTYFLYTFILGFLINNIIFILNTNILNLSLNYSKVLATGITFFVNFFIKDFVIKKL